MSYRSTDAVLRAVDAVFARDPARVGVAEGGQTIKHNLKRVGQAGLVELWPAVEPRAPLRHHALGFADRGRSLATRRRTAWQPSSPRKLPPGSAAKTLGQLRPDDAGWRYNDSGAQPHWQLGQRIGARLEGARRAGGRRRPHGADRTARGDGPHRLRPGAAFARRRFDLGDSAEKARWSGSTKISCSRSRMAAPAAYGMRSPSVPARTMRRGPFRAAHALLARFPGARRLRAAL